MDRTRGSVDRTQVMGDGMWEKPNMRSGAKVLCFFKADVVPRCLGIASQLYTCVAVWAGTLTPSDWHEKFEIL